MLLFIKMAFGQWRLAQLLYIIINNTRLCFKKKINFTFPVNGFNKMKIRIKLNFDKNILPASVNNKKPAGPPDGYFVSLLYFPVLVILLHEYGHASHQIHDYRGICERTIHLLQ